MQAFWTRDFLVSRIDRCYLVASWTRTADRRATYLQLARHYRAVLARLAPAPSAA